MLCDMKFPDHNTKPTHVAAFRDGQFYVVLDQIVYVKIDDNPWRQSSYDVCAFEVDIVHGHLVSV